MAIPPGFAHTSTVATIVKKRIFQVTFAKMKELLELRVNREFAHLLFAPEKGEQMGAIAKVVAIPTDDPRVSRIPAVREALRRKGKSFFYGWRIGRR